MHSERSGEICFSAAHAAVEIYRLPAFQDNYLWLGRIDGFTFAVDPGDAAVVQAELERRGWGLDAILITHHHDDHVGGVGELVQRYQPVVYGNQADPGLAGFSLQAVGDGEFFRLAGIKVLPSVLPGHTPHHVVYLLEIADTPIIFVGDVLFPMGCGYTPIPNIDAYVASMHFFQAQPPTSMIFCAHEYARKNAEFALAYLQRLGLFLDSGVDAYLQDTIAEHMPQVWQASPAWGARCMAMRNAISERLTKLPEITVPFVLGDEFGSNIFLPPFARIALARENTELRVTEETHQWLAFARLTKNKGTMPENG